MSRAAGHIQQECEVAFRTAQCTDIVRSVAVPLSACPVSETWTPFGSS